MPAMAMLPETMARSCTLRTQVIIGIWNRRVSPTTSTRSSLTVRMVSPSDSAVLSWQKVLNSRPRNVMNPQFRQRSSIEPSQYLTKNCDFRKVNVRPFLGSDLIFSADLWGKKKPQRYLGHVRQLVDSLPYKEEVRGSSPFVPTISIYFAGS